MTGRGLGRAGESSGGIWDNNMEIEIEQQRIILKRKITLE